MPRLLSVSAFAAALVLPVAVSAHPHTVVTPNRNRELANGQNHAPCVGGESCGGDPAAYGLETARHGPDAGRLGKEDGCSQTTGGVPPGEDVENPVIR